MQFVPDNFTLSTQPNSGHDPADYLTSSEIIFDNHPGWLIEDDTDKIWMKAILGDTYRIVHVTHDVMVNPCTDYHVEIGAYQTQNRASELPVYNYQYIKVHDSRNELRPKAANYMDVCHTGFHSDNVRPSVIANEVLFTVFFQPSEKKNVTTVAKIASFEVIAGGTFLFHHINATTKSYFCYNYLI